MKPKPHSEKVLSDLVASDLCFFLFYFCSRSRENGRIKLCVMADGKKF